MRRVLLGLGLLGLLATTGVIEAAGLKGEIKCDGSSTVYLITEAVVANFNKENPDVKVSVGISGTGGGFKKFAQGETDISNASRTIRGPEQDACAKKGIEFVELQVAWDGLAVVIHPENTWAKKMTTAQLKKVWHPDTAAKKWSELDSSWPNEEIKLFGAGPDSGTFDYFTEAVNGKEKISRKDYQASEDDNTLVTGVAGNKYALGYFGVAYYEENKDKLGVVAVSGKNGEYVLPTKQNVLSKAYPISRPLFIYVKKSSLKRPEMEAFVRFYQRRDDLVEQAKYIKLTPRQRAAQQEKFQTALRDLR